MRLLDRYLLKELIVPVAYAFVGFYIFYVAFDVFNYLPAYQQNNLGGREILLICLYKTPEFLAEVLPVALLLGMLYALSQHSRNNELVAIRAAGVNIWRLSAPYFFVGLSFSLGLFASNELLMPRAKHAKETVMQSKIADPQRKTDEQWRSNISFKNDSERRSWNIGAFNLITYSLRRVDVGWTDDYGGQHRMFAEQGKRENDRWVFENVEMHQPDAANSGFPLKIITNRMVMPGFTESPELIASEIKISSMSSMRMAKRPRFSLKEIQDYLMLHPKLTGRKLGELTTQFHGRLALPWRCLIVVLLALPFGLLPGRRNVMVGVGMAIGLVFCFLFLTRLSLALGTGGHFSGWVAGWLPLILFGGGGAYLIRRNA